MIRFEMEIALANGLDNLYVIKFTKLSGDTAKYNELCSQLYKQIDM